MACEVPGPWKTVSLQDMRVSGALMAWCGMLQGVLQGAGAKSFIGAKFDLKNEKFVLGQGKENLFLV